MQTRIVLGFIIFGISLVFWYLLSGVSQTQEPVPGQMLAPLAKVLQEENRQQKESSSRGGNYR